jgi:hypothetical protein
VAAGVAAAGSEAAGAAAAAGSDAAGSDAAAEGAELTGTDGLAGGDPAEAIAVPEADGATDPDTADDLVGTGETAVDPASSPVRVGAAAEAATFTAASETAEDREDRVARNHTMPISTATASATAATLRTQ